MLRQTVYQATGDCRLLADRLDVLLDIAKADCEIEPVLGFTHGAVCDGEEPRELGRSLARTTNR
jgi:hypothetical protein